MAFESVSAPRQESSLSATAAKLATHEEVCALRYSGIIARIGRLEALVVAAAGAIITALVVAVWQLSHLVSK